MMRPAVQGRNSEPEFCQLNYRSFRRGSRPDSNRHYWLGVEYVFAVRIIEMVVRVGLAPTLFLMWQIYSLLRSLLSHLTIEIAERFIAWALTSERVCGAFQAEAG